ncbi:Spy/CpxP family protein refolding chaperone [Fischerella sp. PCC 9605]|uniref:Spy/CpxP family protein refolding chaperone n=1 Tax=Fischerella sp. PCC 9605 TaxID=1173024 RepID=UPI00047DAD8F|nr:hypothetical protein [Fischerella sp. PCC 9605]
MKLSKLFLIAGAAALSLTAIPFAVKAETTSSSSLILAQTTETPVREKGPFQRLGLTDAQKNQMEEIRRNTRAEIDRILTPEQRQQLETARQNRQGKRQVWRNLNLTEEQRTQMQQIMQSKRSQMEAVLTPEQKQQLQEFRDNMRSRRQKFNRSNR